MFPKIWNSERENFTPELSYKNDLAAISKNFHIFKNKIEVQRPNFVFNKESKMQEMKNDSPEKKYKNIEEIISPTEKLINIKNIKAYDKEKSIQNKSPYLYL